MENRLLLQTLQLEYEFLQENLMLHSLSFIPLKAQRSNLRVAFETFLPEDLWILRSNGP